MPWMVFRLLDDGRREYLALVKPGDLIVNKTLEHFFTEDSNEAERFTVEDQAYMWVSRLNHPIFSPTTNLEHRGTSWTVVNVD